MDPHTTVDELIAQTRSLPLLPAGIARLLALNPLDVTFLDEACSIIRGDQALAAQILKLANSVQYGGQAPVTTVERAFMRVGSRMIAARLAEGQVLRIFNTRDPVVVRLWHMSSLAASLAELIATRHAVEAVAPEAAYTYGFLYDIGWLVFVALYHDRGASLVSECLWGPRRRSLEHEKEALGVLHTEVGTITAAQWSFPPDLVSVIGLHHHEDRHDRKIEDSRLNRAIDLIALVDAVVAAWLERQIDAGHPVAIESALSSPFLQGVVRSLGIAPPGLNEMLGLALAKVEDKRTLFGVPPFPPLGRDAGTNEPPLHW